MTFGFEFHENINGAIDGLQKVGDGISGITQSVQSGNVAGAVNGAVNVVAGMGDSIASIFGDGSARTKRLSKEIAKSEEQVRRLNMAYKELERTVDSALGAEELRARRSQIENKQAELAEIQRQMRLEKSKRSKDKDKERIKNYETQIQDLEHEIEDLSQSITETLLGSNIKSAAEDFVSTWVSAWRAGEDTMDALDQKFDSMVDNMIAKSVASYMVSKRLQGIFDAVDKATEENSLGGAEITMDELRQLRSIIGDKSIAEQINDDLTNLYNALGIAYGVNNEANKNLSNLQQGIQGVTEDTAGAIEAYMNIVSQRAFERNEYLREIRDCVVSFDLDIQGSIFSQMLLQLQQSYTVQLALQEILTSVLTPNGRAFMVEIN